MAEELNYSKEEPAKKKYKSEKSTMYSFVRFYNRTARFVDVVWLNYEGLGVKYVTLKPKQFVDINTFVGHPWIFRDSQTGEKMVTQMKDVYEPERWTGEQQHAMPQRKLVSITIPGRFCFLLNSPLFLLTIQLKYTISDLPLAYQFQLVHTFHGNIFILNYHTVLLKS